MKEQQFKAELDAAGYECSELNAEPNRNNEMHSHAWHTRLLIQAGEFTLITEDGEHTYGPGDAFEVAANTPHRERTGPSGAQGLVGKKQP